MKQISFFSTEKKALKLLFEEKIIKLLFEVFLALALLVLETTGFLIHKTGSTWIHILVGFVCLIVFFFGILLLLVVISAELTELSPRHARMILSICILSFETFMCYIAPSFFVKPFILFPLIVFQIARMMNNWQEERYVQDHLAPKGDSF